jgi:hypothetical protein
MKSFLKAGMAELADAADSKSCASKAPTGEVLFFLCFPLHPNVDPNSNVRFSEVWNGAVVA